MSETTAVDRLLAATNAHDVDGIVACFADDYALDSPLHPARSFRGRDQVRRNWTQILGAVPDLVARLVDRAVDDRTHWTEWEMVGTRRDGAAHCMRGVFIFTLAAGRDAIARGRMYLEPIDPGPADQTSALREILAETES